MNKNYKRWTERAKDGSPALITERIFYEIKKSQGEGKKHYFADNGDVLDIVTRYLAKLEDKIENGTLVEIKTIAKIMNNTFGCPCEYGLDVYAVSQYDDWCEKSCGGVCDADNYTACWETYLTTKLKELKGEEQ